MEGEHQSYVDHGAVERAAAAADFDERLDVLLEALHLALAAYPDLGFACFDAPMSVKLHWERERMDDFPDLLICVVSASSFTPMCGGGESATEPHWCFFIPANFAQVCTPVFSSVERYLGLANAHDKLATALVNSFMLAFPGVFRVRFESRADNHLPIARGYVRPREDWLTAHFDIAALFFDDLHYYHVPVPDGVDTVTKVFVSWSRLVVCVENLPPTTPDERTWDLLAAWFRLRGLCIVGRDCVDPASCCSNEHTVADIFIVKGARCAFLVLPPSWESEMAMAKMIACSSDVQVPSSLLQASARDEQACGIWAGFWSYLGYSGRKSAPDEEALMWPLLVRRATPAPVMVTAREPVPLACPPEDESEKPCPSRLMHLCASETPTTTSASLSYTGNGAPENYKQNLSPSPRAASRADLCAFFRKEYGMDEASAKLLMRAESLQEVGQLRQAAAYFREVLKVCPDCTSARINLDMIEQLGGLDQPATSPFAAAAATTPRNAEGPSVPSKPAVSVPPLALPLPLPLEERQPLLHSEQSLLSQPRATTVSSRGSPGGSLQAPLTPPPRPQAQLPQPPQLPSSARMPELPQLTKPQDTSQPMMSSESLVMDENWLPREHTADTAMNVPPPSPKSQHSRSYPGEAAFSTVDALSVVT